MLRSIVSVALSRNTHSVQRKLKNSFVSRKKTKEGGGGEGKRKIRKKNITSKKKSHHSHEQHCVDEMSQEQLKL